MPDFDSPWKEALEAFFQPFLALFFPNIHADIDWSRGHVFLDKELQKIAPKAGRGRMFVDKLVKVWRKDGRDLWVLIHIEVQTQRERGLPKRMYAYNTRIADRYNRTVVSLAVLADDDPRWRPEEYEEELWGWSVRMTWPTVKLLDYANRVAELEANSNPIARVVLAHLKAIETRGDPASRRSWKFYLVRALYESGFSSEDVRRLFRVIDWLMELPPALNEEFEQELDDYEERLRMPFVDSFERRGMRKAVEHLLRTRFGEEAVELSPLLVEIDDAEKYLDLIDAVNAATTLDEARRACTKAVAALRRKRNRNTERGSSRT